MRSPAAQLPTSPERAMSSSIWRSTACAARRRASSRRADRLDFEKKWLSARLASCGTYTLPSFRRAISSSGGRSITSISASSRMASGTVSRTRTRVKPATISFRLAICWMLSVVSTSMPASRSSSTSCQRLGWRQPGALVWASSSINATCGRRASIASRSNSVRVWAPWAMDWRGRISKGAVSATVSARPWVSMTPATTSVPPASMAAPCRSIS